MSEENNRCETSSIFRYFAADPVPLLFFSPPKPFLFLLYAKLAVLDARCFRIVTMVFEKLQMQNLKTFRKTLKKSLPHSLFFFLPPRFYH